ncbi:MAG: nucleoside-diphosphate kinase [Phycisphaerae bacterium]|nr:nucleoside-diphosphate kinase [Phycisphaerae bacterium]
MTERTLIIIKPDGIQRRLVGEIIQRFENKAAKIVAAKFMQVPEELSRKVYAVHKGKPFFEPLTKLLSSSPVLVIVWEARNVIDITRKIIGATSGFEAQMGTIRGDFSCSTRYNLVHSSDSPESAEYEINLFFRPDEIVDYELTDEKWLYCEND